MARLDHLPSEVIQLILTHLNPSQPRLAKLAVVSHCLSAPAQYLLFANTSITSLDQFDALLDLLQPLRPGHRPQPVSGGKVDSDLGWSDDDTELHTSPWARALGTTRLRVECRKFGQRGWGTRLGRLLRLAPNVQSLELRGFHDLRIKFLQGRGGATSLSITSTTFKNHALTTSPDLASFLRSVTKLTLSNLGLPLPSTHVQQILTHCSHNLVYLALSALRDLHSPELLLPLFALLRPASAPRLRHLRFGSIDPRQAAIIARSDCLPQLTQLRRLHWTFPNPTRELLDATPAGVDALVLKPRAGAVHAEKEERMQAMQEEDQVAAVVLEALVSGALVRRGTEGVREVWWGGADGAGRRMQAAAGDRVRVHLADELTRS